MKTPHFGRTSLCLLALALSPVACSAEGTGPGGAQDSTNPNGTGASGSQIDLGTGGTGSGGSGPAKIGACGGEERSTTQVPPELLILLDRSGSMVENNVEGGVNSRWVEATQALSAALMSTQAGINWGLKLYPDDDWCGVSVGANVPVAPNNAAAIMDAYTTRPPVAGKTHTPTRSAVEQGQAYIQSLTTPNPKAMVLVTDGEPNCKAPWDADGKETDEDGERDVEPPIAAVANAYAAGIPVYVVGFSISKENTAAALNNIAQAGGRATSNPFASYYTAEDAAQFQAAMQEISADVKSCTFELEEEPPQGVAVTLYVEKNDNSSYETIGEDSSATDGWTYTDATTIEIYGPACDRVLNGTDETLKVGYDCVVR